jgi:hypothetical protein
MLEFQNQIKIYHWQTYGYAEHKTFDKLYNNVSENIDKFIEIYMGKYGRIIGNGNFVLTLANYKTSNPVQTLDTFITYLTVVLPLDLNPAKDTDLLNVRDEILGNVNTTKYLLTLK